MTAWNYDPLFSCWLWHGITQLFKIFSVVHHMCESFLNQFIVTNADVLLFVSFLKFCEGHFDIRFTSLSTKKTSPCCIRGDNVLTVWLGRQSNKRTLLSSLMSLCLPWSPLVPLRIRKRLYLLVYDRVNKRNATLHTSKDKCGHIKHTFPHTQSTWVTSFFIFLPIRHCERLSCRILTLFVLRIGFKGQSVIGGESEEQICQLDNPWGYVFTICERSVSLTLNLDEPQDFFSLYVASLMDLIPSALSLSLCLHLKMWHYGGNEENERNLI